MILTKNAGDGAISTRVLSFPPPSLSSLSLSPDENYNKNNQIKKGKHEAKVCHLFDKNTYRELSAKKALFARSRGGGGSEGRGGGGLRGRGKHRGAGGRAEYLSLSFPADASIILK